MLLLGPAGGVQNDPGATYCAGNQGGVHIVSAVLSGIKEIKEVMAAAEQKLASGSANDCVCR